MSKDKELHGLSKLTDEMIIQNQQREIGMLKSEIDELKYENETLKYSASSKAYGRLGNKIGNLKAEIEKSKRAIEKLKTTRDKQSYERDIFREELKKYITHEEMQVVYNKLNNEHEKRD